ncbi:Adenylosuccinate synthetase [Pelagophyceae sp. CCMP2097]|nr:Adenylosuccinate synthetase [Pelagophyceae sp. CCMP2097]|mmetsp:Transcript_20223/g.68500  ORF Transcript_20223/g.68500 Transcript_20223/m.68500 type:complete len:447 (-) Transcript_20223:193-1533(-)
MEYLASVLGPKKDLSGAESQVTVILGAQWGDEGKGKLVDLLAGNVQIVARFNGGANAGHTLEVDGKKFAFHLLPCGMLRKGCKNVIGNGVVVHLPSLLSELASLEDPAALGRLVISSRAHVLLDSHQRIDGDLEAEKEGKALGTTKRGIGPCYASKANRNGLRFADLVGDPAALVAKLDALRKFQSIHYVGASTWPVTEDDAELVALRAATEILRGCVVDTVTYVHDALDRGERVLAEGANAALLDPDFGTYPFVTSSSTTAGGVCTGLGVAPRRVDCVVGVVKAYLTRVGAGPFPTELFDKDGEFLQVQGREFGTTTGRTRRCGWLDAQMVRYSDALNGYSSINLTKLDVLTGLAKLKIATAYVVDGARLPKRYMPADLDELAKVTVEYQEYPGWVEDISKVSRFEDLPANAQGYIRAIEEHCGVPVSWVGTGPGRDDMFLMPGL